MKEPEIVDMQPKKLVGIRLRTSLADDKTSLLWNRFMKFREAIKNRKSDDLFSVQLYGNNFISGEFSSQSEFEKWAATEVNDYHKIPQGLEKLELTAGKYAVFVHKGTAQDFAETSKNIFEKWLPSSEYQLDDRPHFEVLGKEYKGPENPDSQEKIWIPISSRE